MEYKTEQELIVDEDDDGGWVDTHHFSESFNLEQKVADMALESKVSPDCVIFIIFVLCF